MFARLSRLFWMKRNQKRRHGDLSFGDPDPGTRDSLGVVEGEDRVFWEKKIEDGLRPLDYPRFYFLSPKDKRQIQKSPALVLFSTFLLKDATLSLSFSNG